ncbi:MAG TPA: UbiD family decarboxylase [Terriglobia bacterium]|nr:UbiD family decarboxylase [Terriglobia bacterium]
MGRLTAPLIRGSGSPAWMSFVSSCCGRLIIGNASGVLELQRVFEYPFNGNRTRRESVLRAACYRVRPMPFDDLRQFVAHLERRGMLRRVRAEVDPVLEASEIAQRVVQENGPALLFERPKGASTPLVMNLFGSMDRIREALGREPAEIGAEILGFVERLNPPSLGALWEKRAVARRAMGMLPRSVGRAPCQEVVEAPDLGRLPILQCWPGDAGRFITFGMVMTRHPVTRRRNLGLYRLQVFDESHTGMHWQSMKGGRGHYWEAERAGEPLPVAVVIGADPIVMISSILPLPEDVDEIAFAGFLRGRRVPMVRAKSFDMPIPASAEIVLEGVVPPGERRREGPFGDHFGHYSDAADFPVFHIQRVTRRRDALYAATVVGRPPQEDKFLGNAAGAMVGPLIRLLHPNVVDMCAYAGAGFHNLLVVSVKERHPKEAWKTAMALLGTGQLSLTKVLALVGPDRDPADFHGVMSDLWSRFEPEDHLWLLPVAPLDTLDFTSFTMHTGSKLVLNACGEIREPAPAPAGIDLAGIDGRIERWRLLAGGLLAVTVRESPRDVLARLARANLPARLIAAVSPDVRIDDDEQLQWGIFTRFDPARDMIFTEQVFMGARPVYRGAAAIDATWKPGYPEPLVMDESVIRLVDRRWNEYWK